LGSLFVQAFACSAGAAAAGAQAAPTARAFPDTSSTVAVISDQLDTSAMAEAQLQFAATHFAGTQKVTREDARHLRQYNPGFVVLHYRLGQALGDRADTAGCQPGGDPLQIIDGNRWVPEWPGDSAVQESWFFHWNGQRVFSCTDGHYLMELSDPGWRQWWSAQVIQQLQDNEDDAVFADSYSAPNYFGPNAWNPGLPVVDAQFEQAWAGREHAFTDYMEGQLAGRWKWIPNVGAWITTRDPSDYSNVDGVMVEDFAKWDGDGYFARGDWSLQMNRALSLTRAGKIVIGQTYVDTNNVRQRLFALGSYLLVKGSHTYVSLDMGTRPAWFPEYGVKLGPALDPLPADVSAYWNPGWNVYNRRFANGLVLVNPGTSSSAVALEQPYLRVDAGGGGPVPVDGSAPGSLAYSMVQSVTLAPHAAAVLLTSR
ncbi:MAG TPA: putative glycoside hydrolase, partial [Chloroflexota bacterium]